ncbi:MAG: FHA domain-containing protein [Lachnospiraceae bacterium]|nr:FHA domain-containing protein [Lachnospiraceae bacterium]
MEIYYGSKGVNNFIEAKISRDDGDLDRNAYVLKMLEGNDIVGMLKPVVSKLDDCTFIRYNITAYSMLEKYFLRQRPDIEIFISILRCICDAITEVEKYLLNPNDLVISANYMLWDMGRNELRLIYVPFYDMDIKNQLRGFIEYIMKIFDYSSTTGTMKMHHIYDVVVSDYFDMNILRLEFDGNVKYRTSESSYFGARNNEITSSAFESEEYSKDYADVFEGDDINMDYSYKNVSFANNYEKPVYTDEEDKNEKIDTLHEILIVINTLMTVALSSLYFMAGRKIHYLIGALASLIILAVNVLVYVLKKEKEETVDADKSMNEFKIYADEITREYENGHIKNIDKKENNIKPPYVQDKKEYKLVPLNDGMLEPVILNDDIRKIIIGRGYKEVDYRINKEQISRVHASITLNEDGIYIEDQNSTNGTYINSEKLEAYEQKNLSIGDIIKLANEEFFVS